jgi:hypothetical protein
MVGLLVAGALLLGACAGAAPAPAPAEASATLSGQPVLDNPSTPDPGSQIFLAASTVDEFELFGPVEEITSDLWKVSGVVFAVGQDTQIDGGLQPGEIAKVHAAIRTDGGLQAREIRAAAEGERPVSGKAEIEFAGILESQVGEVWVIGGNPVAMGSAELKDTPTMGDQVKVHAFVNADGSLTAREVEMAQSDVVPDSDLSNVADDLAKPDGEIEFVGAVDAKAATKWTVGGTDLAIVGGTEVKGAIDVGSLVKVHAFRDANSLLTAREIELADGDLNDDGDGMLEAGEDFKLVGVLEAIGDNLWTVGGQTIVITPDTQIEGQFAVGQAILVEVVAGADGSLVAKEVKSPDKLSDDDGGSGGDRSGSNSGSDSSQDLNDDHGGSGGSGSSGSGGKSGSGGGGGGGGSDD